MCQVFGVVCVLLVLDDTKQHEAEGDDARGEEEFVFGVHQSFSAPVYAPAK
jgi:hypothetical protein